MVIPQFCTMPSMRSITDAFSNTWKTFSRCISSQWVELGFKVHESLSFRTQYTNRRQWTMSRLHKTYQNHYAFHVPLTSICLASKQWTSRFRMVDWRAHHAGDRLQLECLHTLQGRALTCQGPWWLKGRHEGWFEGAGWTGVGGRIHLESLADTIDDLRYGLTDVVSRGGFVTKKFPVFTRYTYWHLWED